jgi:hypothetical protein
LTPRGGIDRSFRRSDAAYPIGRSRNGVSELARRGNVRHMRAMFVIWIALIASGITFFTIIGLTHG